MAGRQEQMRPRGVAMELATKLSATIAAENKRRKGRLTVTQLLRALEWMRYTVTEACVKNGIVPDLQEQKPKGRKGTDKGGGEHA